MTQVEVESKTKIVNSTWNKFYIFCVSQFISLLGSGLTGFVLTVMLFTETKIVSALSVAALCDKLPGILLGPIAGVLVDSWNKKSIILLMDLLAAINTMWLVIVLWVGSIELWYIYIVIGSSLRTFHVVSFSAIIPSIINKNDLVKANGLVQTIIGSANTLAPILAGVILGILQAKDILIIDLASFLVASIILFFLRLEAEGINFNTNKKTLNVIELSKHGVNYIRRNRPLLFLLIYISSINFIVGFLHVLLTPMILGFADEGALGVALGSGAAGMLAGSVAVTIRGTSEKFGRDLCVIAYIEGLFMFLTGLLPNIVFISCTLFCLFFCFPYFASCSQAIWQRKVPMELQGRVFALKQVCIWSGLSLAYLVSGPLVDLLVTPMLASSIYSESIGQYFGVEQHRGIGLLLMILGILIILIASMGMKNKDFRKIESSIHDKV